MSSRLRYAFLGLTVLLLGVSASAQALDSATFVSQSVPTTMAPGQTYAVSVTMQNTGDTTWTASSLYRLGAQNPQDNNTWGLGRVELPNDVAPGATVTFNFNVTAPTAVATYNFQWRMVEDGVAWFGDFTPNVAVKDGVNAATFVSQSVPATMAPGQTYAVSVTMQNTGNTTWTAGSLYRLGAQNPQDNTTWGLGRVELPNSVAPGQTVTFNFNVTAPTTVATYNFQWRMVEDTVEWFGDFTPNVAVKDGVNGATFVSQSVPTTMAPGQTYAVSVTMQNTGNTTWTAGSLYRLGAQNPQDNNTWGLGRVELPNDVAPGATVTFNFNVTAPTSVATYNFQWRMVEDTVEWFGDFTPNVAVKDGVNAATFVSQSVPATMVPGQTYAVSVTMQNTGNTTWTSGSLYRLGAQNPQDNNTWGLGRVELPNSVAPGATVTFNFNVTAPTTVATYNFQWRMVEDTVEWFGDFTPNVAVSVQGAPVASVYYIYTDQLNSPRAITNAANTVVWSWNNTDPYGNNVANTDPDGDGNAFVFNLRFPGQYYDQETGTNYNLNRDYDSSTGRYVESDPIGLNGGINTYVYTSDIPLRVIDPDGLDPLIQQQGQQIANTAAQWFGTPFVPGGDTRAGADCSGITWAIYKQAGFPYSPNRVPTGNFVQQMTSGTTPVAGKFFQPTTPQAGDIMFWPGHMAIYDPNASGDCPCKAKADSNMFSSHSRDHPLPYGPANSQSWFGGAPPTYYRWDTP